MKENVFNFVSFVKMSSVYKVIYFMGVTRTYGQLHFLELGWERFESLILGMVFKWRR